MHSPQSVMCFVCLVTPHWSAFLDEGPDPLLSIPECQVVHHHLGGRGVRCISALSHLSLEETQERSHEVFRLMIHYHENSSNTKHEGKVKGCTSGKWPCRGLPPVGWLDTPAERWLKSPPPDAPLAPPYWRDHAAKHHGQRWAFLWTASPSQPGHKREANYCFFFYTFNFS